MLGHAMPGSRAWHITHISLTYYLMKYGNMYQYNQRTQRSMHINSTAVGTQVESFYHTHTHTLIHGACK